MSSKSDKSGFDAVLPSYGRRHGRPLRKSRSELMQTLLPKLIITLPEGPFDLAQIFDAPGAPLWFELGFGGGEHLVEQARRNPHVHFIGCEPYINGVASLLSTIEKYKLSNIRLYDHDARMLLEKLPDACIDRLFVLFPDPWPKIRHHKRRVFSQTTLGLFYRVLKKSGLLRIATDPVEYGEWILEHLLAFGRLKWTAKSCSDWQNPPANWVPTRYQGKAEAEGRAPLFLEWVKE